MKHLAANITLLNGNYKIQLIYINNNIALNDITIYCQDLDVGRKIAYCRSIELGLPFNLKTTDINKGGVFGQEQNYRQLSNTN